MSNTAYNAVVLITSRSSSRFGTGFIVHHDSQGAFVVTCAHVIEEVGSEDAVVNHRPDLPVSLITSGMSVGVDLAVLLARGLTDRPALQLSLDAAPDLSVVITGYRFHTQRGHILRSIRGTLGNQVYLQTRGIPNRAPAWDLRIEGDEQLADGYSGSPIVEEESGLVIAIASHLEREGRRGQAISANAITTIWPLMPHGIIARRTVSASSTSNPECSTSPRTTPGRTVQGSITVAGGGAIQGPAIGVNNGTVISNSKIDGDVVSGWQEKIISYNNYYQMTSPGQSLLSLDEAFTALRTDLITGSTTAMVQHIAKRMDLLREALATVPLDIGQIQSAMQWIQKNFPYALDRAKAVVMHPTVWERAAQSGQLTELKQLLDCLSGKR